MIIIPIVFGLLIAVAIGVAASKSVKKEVDKANAEKAMKLLDEKDDFKKFLDYDSSKSSGGEPKSQPQTYVSQPSKQQMTEELKQRLEELKRRQAQRNEALKQRLDELRGQTSQGQQAKASNVVATSHHDSHCDVSHRDSGDKYRVEYVPTMNSIGGKSTEGCADHYNVRYVKLDDEADDEMQLTPLQKTIVYGEVINQPAFKRGYRGYRLR